MQNLRYVLLILAIFTYGIYSIWKAQKGQAFKRNIQGILDAEGYDKFCEELYSKTGRSLFSTAEIYQMNLDSAIDCDKSNEAKRLMDELKKFPMRDKDFINYNMNALNYAVQKNDIDLAQRACTSFHRRKRHAKYAQEADQVRDIYILHQANHISELIAFSEKVKNPSSKAMAYFRLAKQYYYIQDMEKVKYYISKASASFPDKTWQTILKDIVCSNYEKLY